jgi:hypothetical protein
LRDCKAGTSLDYIDNLTLEKTIEEFYANFTCNEPKQSQHEFIFDYMLPTFQTVFTEIGHTNLTSQSSIDQVQNYDLKSLNYLEGVFLTDNNFFNWQDYYFYFSLQGLYNTDAFKNEIENNQKKNSLCNAYRYLSRQFTKDCN